MIAGAGEGLPEIDRSTLDLLPDPAWITPPERGAAYVNTAWLALTGTTERLVPIEDFLQFVHSDDRERIGSDWRAACAAGAPFAMHYRIRGADRHRPLVADARRADPAGRCAHRLAGDAARR